MTIDAPRRCFQERERCSLGQAVVQFVGSSEPSHRIESRVQRRLSADCSIRSRLGSFLLTTGLGVRMLIQVVVKSRRQKRQPVRTSNVRATPVAEQDEFVVQYFVAHNLKIAPSGIK